MENTAHGCGVLAEHGLSFLIGEDGHRTLFDTGEGLAIRNNAAKFHVDLSSVDTLVLSHGHYDYTGGVVCLPAKRTPRPVYVHPAAFESKFSLHEHGQVDDVGMPSSCRSALMSDSFEIHSTEGPKIADNDVLVTGEVPRHTAYEDVGGAFFVDEECTVPDSLVDALKRYDVRRVGPCHCTGSRAVQRMQADLSDRFRLIESGTLLEFE